MQNIKKIENFLLETKIGEGQFGEVFRAKEIDSGKVFAIKVIPKSLYEGNKLMRRQLKLETSIMNRMSHPNLMHLHKSFETMRNYYLVLDLCEGGDLEKFMVRNKIKNFSEKEALSILAQIRDGFVELRKKDIMHRDFKLENIFLRKGRVILGDFGAAKVVKEMTSTTVGTPLNMAPEVLEGSDYNHKSDLWSIGIVFYRLIVGKPPFFAFSIGELKKKAIKLSGQNLGFKKKTHLCGRVKTFLRSMLEPDPEKRMTWKQFFEHPIFDKEHLNSCTSIQECALPYYLDEFKSEEIPKQSKVLLTKLN
jgi:serine/threonine-protein kinase ULK/ATG1